MTAYAQSVTGPVSETDLGRTLMHEHILCDLRHPNDRETTAEYADITMENRFQTDYFQNRNPVNMFLDDDGIATREIELFGTAGGRTIVELTVGGLNPQPGRLAKLSAETGINIIAGAGYYVDSYLPESICNAAVDELAELMVRQLCHGFADSEVCAGLIGEIGCSWPLMPSERRMLAASAEAQKQTGAAISIHPGRNPDSPREIADALEDAGADPSRTVIGHMDRTIFDDDRLTDLLRRGFVLEWDFFGIETSQYWMAGEDLDLPTDYMRLDLIHSLVKLGFENQVVVSHDICTRTRLASYGGHGYSHLIVNIIPMMQRRGWSDNLIEQLFEKTPSRLLCYLSGPASLSSGEAYP